MTNVVPLLLRTASERRNEIFCASEREFPEFPKIPSGITNLAPRMPLEVLVALAPPSLAPPSLAPLKVLMALAPLAPLAPLEEEGLGTV